MKYNIECPCCKIQNKITFLEKYKDEKQDTGILQIYLCETCSCVVRFTLRQQTPLSKKITDYFGK